MPRRSAVFSAPMATQTVAYIRVSTAGQDETGMGLAVQRDAILAYAAFHGLEVGQWYRDVESGAKEDRAGLNDLRAAVRTGGVARVLAYKLDRLARDVLLAETIHREWTLAGVAVISVSEAIDDSPAGQLMRRILSAFAQFERATIALRTASGRRARVAHEGTHHGGVAPFGYKTVGTRAAPGHGALMVDERQAAAVRRCFALLDGTPLGYTAIAAMLDGEGHWTARGARFTAVQVRRIAQRRAVYTGMTTAARSIALAEGVTAKQEAIIGSKAE